MGPPKKKNSGKEPTKPKKPQATGPPLRYAPAVAVVCALAMTVGAVGRRGRRRRMQPGAGRRGAGLPQQDGHAPRLEAAAEAREAGCPSRSRTWPSVP
ncbi:hypothetical protein DIPPA_27159 [Diplonema papillatum]|nr:hypothetical protein DIPPA_27159 [Diplonema papillatum]